MNKTLLSVIVLGAMLLTACGGQSQTAAEPVAEEAVEEVQVEEPLAEEAPLVEEEAVVEEAPVAEEEVVEEQSISDSGTLHYMSPDEIFTIDIPADWTHEDKSDLIDEGVVDVYTSPDGHAAVQVVVADVLADTSAVLKGEYTLDYMKRLNGDDLRVATDVIMDDGRERLDWWSDANLTSGSAYFAMQDTTLYFFNVVYEDKYEDETKNVIEAIADSFAYAGDGSTAKEVTDEDVTFTDSGMIAYTSPEDIFTLEIPPDWKHTQDSDLIDEGVVDIYTAPDGHAAVQIAVAEALADTSAVLKGEYTLDYLKRLNGDDLRVATDVTLDDGRERLDWWSDANVTSGSAYFDMQDTNLFFFNLAYEDKYEDDYKATLEEIADSFSY